MTRRRNDSHSTEFGLWVRDVEELHSKKYGFVFTNLDFICTNYKTKWWMLLEEKRYMSNLSFAQEQQFRTLHTSIKSDRYLGFHVVQFENTSPADGKIFLNKKLVSKILFINFLAFKCDISYYKKDYFFEMV